MFNREGDIFPIMKVNVFDVNDSWRSLVNFDYLNEGIFFPPLDKLYITFPNVVSDWFIFFSSLKWSFPIYSFLLTFSDPARSHKLSLAFLKNPLLSGWIDYNKIWKIVCDLLLFVFIEVCLINLFFYPRFIN